MSRIKEKRSAILCPTIDNIDDKTLGYYSTGGGQSAYGIFTWSLFFTWGAMPDRIRKNLKSSRFKKILFSKLKLSLNCFLFEFFKFLLK